MSLALLLRARLESTRTRTVETDGGVTVHRLPLPVPGAPPVNPFATGEVRELLRSGGFDVAHAHMGVVSPFATDLVDVALATGLATAVTWHCVIDRSAPLFRALGHARRWVARGAALSAVSSMAAARVAGIADGAEVRVLGNGIDVEAWRPGTDQVREDDDVVRVVVPRAPHRVLVADALGCLLLLVLGRFRLLVHARILPEVAELTDEDFDKAIGELLDKESGPKDAPEDGPQDGSEAGPGEPDDRP